MSDVDVKEFAGPGGKVLNELLARFNTLEMRVKKIEELPDTKAILDACKEIHEAHVQFATSTRSLQERMIDAAEIKTKIEVIRNRCNNVMQIAPAIENFMALMHSFAAKLGGALVNAEGVYVFQLNKGPRVSKKAKKHP
jgi:hypothetical protein